METRKTEIKFFTIMDFMEEAEYLTEMHGKGWKFAYVTFPGIYHFTKCQPEKVIYQLDYNKEGRKHFAEYKQMFEDMGWEYLLDFVGYSYFRKPANQMEEDEEIFCDDDSRLDMLKRIFIGRVIPMLVLLAFCILPMLISSIVNKGTDYSIPGVLTGYTAVLLIVYIGVFLKFGLKYSALKKNKR